MPWISAFAIYFIIWWTVLFAVLPFSLRTQEEENNVTPGTVSSAPVGPHMRRAALRTTIVSLGIFAVLYYVFYVAGLGFDDLPKFLPDYNMHQQVAD